MVGWGGDWIGWGWMGMIIEFFFLLLLSSFLSHHHLQGKCSSP